MVTHWGFSEKLGPLSYAEEQGEVFLGHSVTQTKGVSGHTAKIIEEEIKVLITRNYDRAERLLKENSDKLEAMAEALMKYETIDSSQIDDIMDGNVPRPPKGWDDSNLQEPPKASSKQKTDKSSNSKIGGPAAQP